MIETHHIRLHTDAEGMVDQVPEIDGKPFPGIQSIVVAASDDKPAVAMIQMYVQLDVEGGAQVVFVEEAEEKPVDTSHLENPLITPY